MDGFELFKTLRDHPATADIPIVIHSAVPLDQLTQLRLKRVRNEDYIEFPIEASELQQGLSPMRCSATLRAHQKRDPHRHPIGDDYPRRTGVCL